MQIRSDKKGFPWLEAGLLRRVALFVVVCLVFLLIMKQAPLYTENQNTKFLHGMAWAGVGALRHDWLAGTLDGLPLFSGLVYLIYACLSPLVTYALFAGLLGVFFFSLEGILRRTYGIPAGSPNHWLLCGSIFLVLSCFHTWYDGVAMQYLLGPYLQPCVFGVFIFLSIRWFLERREAWASAALALAYLMHPAYLFLAVVLTAVYLVELHRAERGWKALFAIVVPFLVCIAAYLSYLGLVFRPTSSQAFARATQILAVERIPYHSLISSWATPGAYSKLALVLLSLYLLRGKPLCRILGWLTGATLGLTLIQAATHSNALALLAPWRTSVVLVPLALFSVIAWLIQRLPATREERLAPQRRKLLYAFSFLLLLLAGRGVRSNIWHYKAYYSVPEMPVIRYIRAHKQPADVFLIPVHDRSFEKFRLEAEAPAFVNWKSHPYKDVEVLEWDARVALAEKLQKASSEELPGLLDTLHDRYGVTHVVARKPETWTAGPRLKQEFADASYALYRIEPTSL